MLPAFYFLFGAGLSDDVKGGTSSYTAGIMSGIDELSHSSGDSDVPSDSGSDSGSEAADSYFDGEAPLVPYSFEPSYSDSSEGSSSSDDSDGDDERLDSLSW